MPHSVSLPIEWGRLRCVGMVSGPWFIVNIDAINACD